MSEHICDQVGDIIAEFLMRHGGLDNGYETWCSGWLHGVSGELEFSFRGKEDYTGKKLRHMSHDLVKKITDKLGLLPQLSITATHIEDGCYHTHIHIRPELHKVDLSKARRNLQSI